MAKHSLHFKVGIEKLTAIATINKRMFGKFVQEFRLEIEKRIVSITKL